MYGQRGDTISAGFPYYLIVALRLCALRYLSVTLKCGVGRLEDGDMNGRCAHGGSSSDGELSPKTSGTRSELSDGPFPCPLEGCELVTSWLSGPAHLTREDRDVLVERLGMGDVERIEELQLTALQCFGG